jgi:hypothetical protein
LERNSKDPFALYPSARPAALAMAYNGGNIGGVIFSPLWAAAISVIGFPAAAAGIVQGFAICAF